MAFPGTFTQRVEFPPNVSQEFLQYAFILLEAYGGLPGDMFFSRDIGSEFTAVFFSCEDLGNFNIAYGHAMKGEVNERLWEKANGPVISSTLTKEALVNLGKMLHDVKPAIDFIESNGGWPGENDSDFPAFFALEKALHAGSVSSDVRSAYEDIAKIMTIVSLANEALKGNIDSESTGGIRHRVNILHMFLDFHGLKKSFEPVIEFIEANGGWSQDGKAFQGYETLCNHDKKNLLAEDVRKSIKDVKIFMEFYIPVKEALGKDATFEILPHNG